ncbi:hypothetical protein F1645_16295 (plasmid) [Novacetimonas hansenii]|uniref:Twin-arginine translocation signal domain-containing protein n=1 Tax=Novacetimonas hansenii TaxID=436 RepID=A0ABQ0SIN2_NOVHA|nr:hypothetical protein [Novacetimonas hansenii]GAN83767.1 hypothetical protein Gaha_0105_002 [Novacetimonas hansenii JCM 7643]GBQ62964.1 hypothetical protein AA0243_3003 [Novacetimonas hansenii NRIC 0243]GEC64172.1 hypothetical protein GHA01_20210 [Novacetimonas hansenii]
MPDLVKIEAVRGTRRNFLGFAFLSGLAVASLAALPGCSSSKDGNVTTITVNVSEIDTDGTAALNILKTVLAFTGLPLAVADVVDDAIDGVEAALATWDKYCSGKQTVVFDATSVPTEASSVIAALQNAATTIGNVATSEAATLGTTLTSKITSVSSDIASLAAIVSSIVRTTAGLSLGAQASTLTPTQARMLQVNGILARHGLPPVAVKG